MKAGWRVDDAATRAVTGRIATLVLLPPVHLIACGRRLCSDRTTQRESGRGGAPWNSMHVPPPRILGHASPPEADCEISFDRVAEGAAQARCVTASPTPACENEGTRAACCQCSLLLLVCLPVSRTRRTRCLSRSLSVLSVCALARSLGCSSARPVALRLCPLSCAPALLHSSALCCSLPAFPRLWLSLPQLPRIRPPPVTNAHISECRVDGIRQIAGDRSVHTGTFFDSSALS